MTRIAVSLAAIAALTAAGTAQASNRFNGPGLILQGVSENGRLLNGPGIILQGVAENGYRWNGPVVQGTLSNGTTIGNPAVSLRSVVLPSGERLGLAE
jgi:hypothetical protein